jgi:hypothetical protein
MKIIVLTRESVSMGDDAFDHTMEVEIEDNWKISQILNKIIKMNYLPNIQGGEATWSAAFNKPLAVLAQQWDKPKIISDPDFPFPNSNKYIKMDRMHFNYHAQIDPLIVYNILREFRTVT